MFSALIIDDDPIQLRITELLVKRSPLFAKLSTFSEADQALKFLQNEVTNSSILPDVILLDLNMPKTDGWAFLNLYTEIFPKLKKNISLFILSSSIDRNDKSRSKEYPFVRGFISKPITSEILQSIARYSLKSS